MGAAASALLAAAVLADALRGVNVPVSPGQPLPAAAPGAIDGTLRCAT